MKTIGTNPKKEKLFPLDTVVKLSPRVRAALWGTEPKKTVPECVVVKKAAKKTVSGYAIVKNAERVNDSDSFGCGDCCLFPFNKACHPETTQTISCSSVVLCRAHDRPDKQEVQFVPCNEVGEPL